MAAEPSTPQTAAVSAPITKDTPLNQATKPRDQASAEKKPTTASTPIADKAFQVIMLIYGFVAAILLFRFALALFGANRDAIFVDFLFQTTAPFMIPFENIFGGPIGISNYQLEFEVLVTVLVYGLVFFGIAKLIKIIFN